MLVKDQQILHFFTHPDEFHRDPELVRNSQDNPTLRGAIQFGNGQGRNFSGSREAEACSRAHFCPVEPSSTSKTSCGASGMIFLTTLLILLSSSIK